MGKLKTQDAVFNVGVNVDIRGINKKTGETVIHRRGHNRCLRLQLMGIAKFLDGQFNRSNPEKTYYDWIPRYLAFGTNLAAYDSDTGVTSVVDINDTKLLNEISPRIQLPERNVIINRSTQSYVQLVINTYVPETMYNGMTIREAGLFSRLTGNNCLFRITFDDITKTEDIVLEVNWTISIISIDSENQPYEDVDKTDLWNAMELLLRRFGEVAPDIAGFCTDLTGAIKEYAKTDSTNASVKSQVDKLSADIVTMADWDVIGITQAMLDKVDDINGEIIG